MSNRLITVTPHLKGIIWKAQIIVPVESFKSRTSLDRSLDRHIIENGEWKTATTTWAFALTSARAVKIVKGRACSILVKDKRYLQRAEDIESRTRYEVFSPERDCDCGHVST